MNEQNAREKALNIPVSDQEMETVKHEAERLGISVSAFIRLLIKNYTENVTFEKKG